jgi:predicted HAD superfamily Cof-like phosphohydrolase
MDRPKITDVVATGSYAEWVMYVKDFHKNRLKYNHPTHPVTEISSEMLEEHLGYLQEEINEIEVAETVEDLIDGLGDLIYYAIGCGLQHGVDLGPIISEIHYSNMEKVHNPNADPYTKRVTKPPNWKPPRILEILEEMRQPGEEIPF